MSRIKVTDSVETYRDKLTGLKPFRTRAIQSSLKGLWSEEQMPDHSGPASWFAFGRLPQEHHFSVKSADYVVYSYDTPIAWHLPPAVAHAMGAPSSGWVMPFEKYSRTTTSHQNTVRFALSEAAYSDGAGNICPGSRTLNL